MSNVKQFLKKNELLVVIVLTLVLIYGILISSQKINVLLDNDIIIDLQPLQKSVSMHYGNKTNVEFNVSVTSLAYCKTLCLYAFTDESRNKTIETGNQRLYTGSGFKKSYEIKAKRMGSGQDIYSFEVTCNTIPSFICHTQSSGKVRSSLVTVNYDLTDEEKRLKSTLRQNVSKLLDILAKEDEEMQKISQKYFELGHKLNLRNLTKSKLEIDESYDKVKIAVESMRNLWSVEAYINLSRRYNDSYFQTLENVSFSIQKLNQSVENILQVHNSVLSRLENINKNLAETGKISASFGEQEAMTEANKIFKELNLTVDSINNNEFNNYSGILEKTYVLEKEQQALIEESKQNTAEMFFKSEYYTESSNDLLCNLTEKCSISNFSQTLQKTKMFMKDYPDSSYSDKACADMEKFESDFGKTKKDSEDLFNMLNVNADAGFLSSAKIYKDGIIKSINNSYFDALQELKNDESYENMIGIANSSIQLNKTNSVEIKTNQSLSLYLLSNIKLPNEFREILKSCRQIAKPIKKKEFNYVSSEVDYSITLNINTELSDNPPICCLFKECKPCCDDESCKDDPNSFPAILLHGHSVAKDNSPEFSLDALNKIQLKLEDDDYLNAGILLPSKNDDTKKGDWGLSNKPISIRVTYYYDFYNDQGKYTIVPTKSESITTYAIRLHDVVELIKYRTNKPKVNIIAFSMGGLVARKYMQIYGDDSVFKLITIGTPHQGVNGIVSRLCPSIGENLECKDLSENSLFLNQLNDPSNQPQKVKIYDIIGKGCPTNGYDGDGVVAADKASLKGIVNNTEFSVNGTCQGALGYFHTDLIDTDKMPQVYEDVKIALKDK